MPLEIRHPNHTLGSEVARYKNTTTATTITTTKPQQEKRVKIEYLSVHLHSTHITTQKDMNVATEASWREETMDVAPGRSFVDMRSLKLDRPHLTSSDKMEHMRHKIQSKTHAKCIHHCMHSFFSNTNGINARMRAQSNTHAVH
jgi:hypothetical protein